MDINVPDPYNLEPPVARLIKLPGPEPEPGDHISTAVTQPRIYH
jgi:hypothetical protein